MFRAFLLSILLVSLTTLPLRADERTQKLTARLTEEAAAFERVAPQVLGTETLEQRAQKAAGRFRVRVGSSAKLPAEPQWQTRVLVSEYGFASFSSDHASAPSLHELRQVQSVDGRTLKASNKASDNLAKIITASDDTRKRALLEQFNQYGLLGAANDFGQLILLFSAHNIGRYEFEYGRSAMLEGRFALVFNYRQIDGPNPLTVLDERKKQTRDVSVAGEIWVRQDNFMPMRVTLVATPVPASGASALPGLSDDTSVRQEATVDYAMSAFGALLPTATHHKEVRGGAVAAENTFTYKNFRRFGASSAIIVDEEAIRVP